MSEQNCGHIFELIKKLHEVCKLLSKPNKR